MSKRSGKRRKPARRRSKQRAPMRRQFVLEALEQRLLLSADLAIAPDLQPDGVLPVDGTLFDPRARVDTALAAPFAEAAADAKLADAAPNPDATDRGQETVGDTDLAPAAASPEDQTPESRVEAATGAAPAIGASTVTEAPRVQARGTFGVGMPYLDELGGAIQIVIVDAHVPHYASLLQVLFQQPEATGESDEDEPAVPLQQEPRPAQPSADEAPSDNVTPPPDLERLADEPLSRQEEMNADADITVFVLAAGEDGLDQVSYILDQYQEVGAVHLLSHGSAGALRLGTSQLSSQTLKEQSARLKRWGNALSEHGDILLYGCDIAQGEVGIEFVDSLAAHTGADVAASTDATGSADRGGDWALEYGSGRIEFAAIFHDMPSVGYGYLLTDLIIDGSTADDTITITDNGNNTFTVSGAGASDGIYNKPDGLLTINGGLGSDTVVVSNLLDLSSNDTNLVINAEHIQVNAGIDSDSGYIQLLAADTGHSFGGTVAEKLALLALGDQLGPVVAEAVNDLSWPIDYIEAHSSISIADGAAILGGTVTISATSTVPPTLISTWPTVNILGVGSSAMVDIVGSTIRATGGALTISSSSQVEVDVTAQSLGTPLLDAAGAVTVVSSKAITKVTGSSTLAAQDQLQITADNTVSASTVADGTVGGLAAIGATTAVSVVVNDTRAYLDGAIAVVGTNAAGDDPALRVAATSSNTVTTTAVATKGGANGDGGIIGKLLGTKQMGTGSNKAGSGTGTGADGAMGGGSKPGTSPLSIAGSLALTVLTDINDAHINATDASNIIDATGAVDVAAITSNTVTTKADSSSTNTPTAVVGAGLAAAANIIVIDSKAYLAGSPVFGADTTAITVRTAMPTASTNTFSATATSGASSGAFGANGAFAMGVSVLGTYAYLDAGAQLDAGGADLSLAAVNKSSSTVKAMAQKEGATGFGAGGSLALNVGVNTTRAEIDGTATLTNAGAPALTAQGEHTLDTTADAGSAGDIALTPAVALTVGVNQTEALLPDGTAVMLAGGLILRANHSGAATTRANASAAGRGAGFGAGIGLTVAVDRAVAEMDRDVTP